MTKLLLDSESVASLRQTRLEDIEGISDELEEYLRSNEINKEFVSFLSSMDGTPQGGLLWAEDLIDFVDDAGFFKDEIDARFLKELRSLAKLLTKEKITYILL
jgi:hypothetical protein